MSLALHPSLICCMHCHSYLTHCVLCLIQTAEWRSHSSSRDLGALSLHAGSTLKAEQAAQDFTVSLDSEDSLAFPHNLFQCLVTLTVEILSLYPAGTSLGLICACYLSSMAHCAGSGFTSPIPMDRGNCWSVPLKPVLPQDGQAQLPQPSLTGRVLQPQPSQCPCAELTPVYQHLCCSGDLKLDARIQMSSSKCQVK